MSEEKEFWIWGMHQRPCTKKDGKWYTREGLLVCDENGEPWDGDTDEMWYAEEKQPYTDRICIVDRDHYSVII